jgi:hypothetical protein
LSGAIYARHHTSLLPVVASRDRLAAELEKEGADLKLSLIGHGIGIGYIDRIGCTRSQADTPSPTSTD